MVQAAQVGVVSYKLAFFVFRWQWKRRWTDRRTAMKVVVRQLSLRVEAVLEGLSKKVWLVEEAPLLAGRSAGGVESVTGRVEALWWKCKARMEGNCGW